MIGPEAGAANARRRTARFLSGSSSARVAEDRLRRDGAPAGREGRRRRSSRAGSPGRREVPSRSVPFERGCRGRRPARRRAPGTGTGSGSAGARERGELTAPGLGDDEGDLPVLVHAHRGAGYRPGGRRRIASRRRRRTRVAVGFLKSGQTSPTMTNRMARIEAMMTRPPRTTRRDAQRSRRMRRLVRVRERRAGGPEVPARPRGVYRSWWPLYWILLSSSLAIVAGIGK